MRGIRVPLLAAVTLLVLSMPAWAVAQASSPATSSASVVTSLPGGTGQTYDLSFGLPAAAKSGCMVCHGDPNLVRIQNGVTVSMYVSAAVLENSAHAQTQCTGCHLDFAYTAPHTNAATEEWRVIAKSSCKNCHQAAFTANSGGVHGPKPTSTQSTSTPAASKSVSGSGVGKPLPLCGDCHGGHDIQMLTDNPEGQQALHEQGKRVCGVCHQDYWDNYDDYYHGAAYKTGAPDAPACWQCHNAHDILRSTDRRSSVNEANLAETCGQCHTHEPNETYLSYSKFIHGKADVQSRNPVYAFFQRAYETIASWFN